MFVQQYNCVLFLNSVSLEGSNSGKKEEESRTYVSTGGSGRCARRGFRAALAVLSRRAREPFGDDSYAF